MAIDEEDLYRSTAETEEASPLLSTSASIASLEKRDSQLHRRRAYMVLFFLLTSLNLSAIVFEPAQARIFESVHCRTWYQEHDPSLIGPGGVAEVHCKIPQVQRDVASLTGWKYTLDAMPGWFADSLPLRLVWFGAVFNLLSGGNIVAEALFCIILSDITPRQGLANIFFVANGVDNATSVVGPIICASLMRHNIWFPIGLALVLQMVSILAAFGLPETLAVSSSIESFGLAPFTTHCQHDLSMSFSPPPATTSNTIYAEMAKSVKALVIIFGDWRMVVLACLYPVRMMYIALLDLLPRYISYRYHWSIASATYLLSLQALGATMCFFILLPLVSDHLGKNFQLGAIQKSVVLARLSLGILGLGLLLQGLAPSISTLICGLLVGTLGAGASSALRALAASLIDHKDNGKVFSGLAVAETISMMAAFPAVAGLYNAGIGNGGGGWLGMPFDVTGLTLGLSTVVLCFLNFGTNSAT